MDADEYDERYRAAPPGCAPGGLLARAVAQGSGELLTERALSMGDPLQAWAEEDGDVANPVVAGGQEVRLHVYDGDTGACVMTMVVRP